MTSPTSPTAGAQYVYSGDQLGERADTALMPGTVVTVREIVPAYETGAHDLTDDAVVIEWESTGRVIVGMTEEHYVKAEAVMGDDGFPVLENGLPKVQAVTRCRPVYEFADGPVPRAMSVPLDTFDSQFVEA